MNERPNILLIVTDEMRGDCMGNAGHPDVKTPYLDSLAQMGVRFPHAYSPCPSCVPARAVLHTGLSPRHAGRVGYQDCVPWNYGCTMAGELTRQGYQTHCAGKMHVYPSRSSMGFCSVELHDGYLHYGRFPGVDYSENQQVSDDYFYWLKNEKGIACDVTDSGVECNSWIARPWPYEEPLHPTNWVASRCIDFLRRRDPRKPFFLMASFVRPHAPYDAPACYFDLYRGRPLRKPLEGDWDRPDWRHTFGPAYNSPTGPEDPELIRQQQIGYYACITHLDHQIGRIWMSLVEHGLRDNTVILFVSDHGEMLSDHCWCHKSLPYQGSIHIPLLIAGPQQYIGRPGRTSDALASLQDIMPTVLSLAGAPVPPHLDGENLLGAPQRTWLHGEHVFRFQNRSSQFIVTRRDKYIWFSQTGEEQYFDLETDPGETCNAIDSPACRQRAALLRSHLAEALAGSEEGYSDGSRLIVGRPPQECLSNATLPNVPPENL